MARQALLSELSASTELLFYLVSAFVIKTSLLN